MFSKLDLKNDKQPIIMIMIIMMMMIVLFIVLSRNKLRIPLEGTYFVYLKGYVLRIP